MNLSEVRSRIQSDADNKWDTFVEPEAIRLQKGRLIGTPLVTHARPAGLRLAPWAQTQLCQRLAIPTAYFKRCPAHLQDAQANYWLETRQGERALGRRRAEPDRWLVRVAGDTARAILSDRYSPLDDTELLTALDPLVNGTRFEMRWFALTDESLHLRLVDPAMGRDVLPGDRLLAGLHIANSEVGKRALTVDALVFRLVCSNGLVRLVKGRSLLHQRHVSVSKARFAVMLRQAVQESLLQGAGFIERMEWATRESVADMDTLLGSIGTHWNLPQQTQERVRTALLGEPRGQQETLYGLINALTQAAQSLESDERYGLETMAGQLLERGLAKALPRLPAAEPRHLETLFTPEMSLTTANAA